MSLGSSSATGLRHRSRRQCCADLRIGTLNVHVFNEASGSEIARFIQEKSDAPLDVLCLNEASLKPEKSKAGSSRCVIALAKALGLPHMSLGNLGWIGNAVLSRFPIIRHQLCTIEDKRVHSRQLVVATLLVPAVDSRRRGSDCTGFIPFTVASTHLEHTDELARIRQVAGLHRHLQE